MNNKVTIAISTALLSMATLQVSASMAPTQYAAETIKAAAPISINKRSERSSKQGRKFLNEKDLAAGTYTYIIRLNDQPIASYDGSISGLSATNPQIAKKSLFSSLARSKKSSRQIRQELRLDLKAPEAVAYGNYLESKQQTFLSKANTKLGSSLDVVYQYKNAFNGMALRLTQQEAEQLSTLAGVAYVERERIEQLETDTGPIHIGATQVWSGEGQSAVNMGEGVIIGVIDSGINSDHPSFADVGGDGYDHTNPWGEGVYVGDCAGDFTSMCNDKLIGVRSYAVITDVYDDTAIFGDNPPPKNGEDYNGHGSHTAGTSGGNIIRDVPLLGPDFGEKESHGITTGFEFGQISGVAPHANIVAYQICRPGDLRDTYSGCSTAAVIAALDDTVEDQIDVINYSISGGGNPWNSPVEMAFLAAQNAGIFSSISAGNDGPNAQTTNKSAPWYTAVGASTHGRVLSFDKEIGEFSGGDTELATLSGSSGSGGITASIVWAGDYTNANDPDGDPAQCLQPFPADTFADEIVVCDRGAINRVLKATNVAKGGAGGFVLGNIDGGANSVSNDVYIVPGIHINRTNGNALRAWLASGSDHMATITAAPGELSVNPEDADVMASFSSRGANRFVPDVMSPSVTAPGMSIYAAYSDQQFGKDINGPAPADYYFAQGTSMSAPHVAGAGAVLRSAHPTWTPDNIRSALMLTAVTEGVKKEDGTTTADFFDMGAGSIRVNLADQTGLVMNETAANYIAANPDEGGDPKTLNIPSVSNTSCIGYCEWTRTVIATKAGTWSLAGSSISNGLGVTVTPESFTLAAGESQTLTISAETTQAEIDEWSFGHVVMTSSEHPTARIPVSVIASNGDVPEAVSFPANRNVDSYLVSDVTAIEITEFTARSYGLTKATKEQATLAVDSDNSSAYDDLSDGINTTLYTVPADAKRFVARISVSEASDLDLRVGIDANGDGIAQEDEQIAISSTATALESVSIMSPAAGSYWVTVQNWAASAEGAEDAYTLATAIVDGELGDNLTVEADTAIAALTPFDILFKWSLADGAYGDMYFGAVDLGTSADEATTQDASTQTAGNLGLIAVDVMRGMDDVILEGNADPYMQRGDTVDYSVTLLNNVTPGDRTHTIKVIIPDGMSLDESSVTGDPVVSGNDITWTVALESLLGAEPYYVSRTNIDDASCVLPNFGRNASRYIDLAAFGLLPNPRITGDGVDAVFGFPANFLGTLYNRFHVTDDGIITFGAVGGNPWMNQLTPNTDAPNNLVAPFWRDMRLISSDTSGVTVADAVGARFTIVEFDDMYHRSAASDPNATDVLDFEVVFYNQTGNFAFAYDNVSHNLGDSLGVTVGWDNASGTSGGADIYSPTFYDGAEQAQVGSVQTIQSGLIICYDLTQVDTSAKVFNFTTKIKDDFTGGAANVVFTNTTDDVNAPAIVDDTGVEIQVEGPPAAIIVGSSPVVEENNVQLDGSGSYDPNGDELSYTWVQLSGVPVSFSADSATINFIAPDVKEDQTMAFQLSVDDGNGNSDTAVTSVIIRNNKVSGSGTFGWLLLLISPMLLLRRRKVK